MHHNRTPHKDTYRVSIKEVLTSTTENWTHDLIVIPSFWT